jgi:hypothetical protein
MSNTFQNFQESLVAGVESILTEMVLEEIAPAKALNYIEAATLTLQAYEKLVRVNSNSNKGYEFQDLPVGEKKMYERSKHLIGVASKIYSS